MIMVILKNNNNNDHNNKNRNNIIIIIIIILILKILTIIYIKLKNGLRISIHHHIPPKKKVIFQICKTNLSSSALGSLCPTVKYNYKRSESNL